MKVSVSACEDYSSSKDAVSRAVGLLGGMKKFVSKGDKVLLKVNHLFGKAPEEVVTTHPEIIRSVVALVREAGGEPYMGDSPALTKFQTAAKRSGTKEISELLGVPMVDLDEPVETDNPKSKVVKSFELSARLKDFDVIISLPKLKTHMLTGMTCAVKNLFGCIPGKNKSRMHLRFPNQSLFSEMLLDLNIAVKPRLTIVDAVIGMEGMGPGAGSPRKIGYIIASESTHATDAVAADIIGLKPSEVSTISAAKKREIAEADIRKITRVGDRYTPIKDFKRAREVAKNLPLKNQLRNLLNPKPVLAADKCIGCGQCRDICPGKAIKMDGDRPHFDYRKCIRCYCCHEICQQHAIDLKDGVFSRMTRWMLR